MALKASWNQFPEQLTALQNDALSMCKGNLKDYKCSKPIQVMSGVNDITMGHRIAVKVGKGTGSVISRTTNRIDVRAWQPLKIGLYYSSPLLWSLLQSPKRRSLLSFICLKRIRESRVEERMWPLRPNMSHCIFMGKRFNLSKTQCS